jgi:hypothetical protein
MRNGKWQEVSYLQTFFYLESQFKLLELVGLTPALLSQSEKQWTAAALPKFTFGVLNGS